MRVKRVVDGLRRTDSRPRLPQYTMILYICQYPGCEFRRPSIRFAELRYARWARIAAGESFLAFFQRTARRLREHLSRASRFEGVGEVLNRGMPLAFRPDDGNHIEPGAMFQQPMPFEIGDA